MSEINRCVPDAWVRGAKFPLPTDPTEFDWPDRAPAVGCNHLVCRDCNAEVKWQDGYDLALDYQQRERVPQRAAQMHGSDDWSKIDGIRVEPVLRLYTCRCFYHSVHQAELTFNPDRTDTTQEPTRNLPWTCAGHPPLADRSAAELAATVVEAAQDPARQSEVLGLYFRTHHGPLEAVVPEALAKAAVGPAPLAPALKSLFEAQTRLAPLSRFVEELLRPPRTKTERRAQLVDVLTSAVWQRPSGRDETGTLELLRDEALAGVTTTAQLRMFEMQDRAWLVAHVKELLAKNPDQAGAVLARAGRAMLFGATEPDAVLEKVGALAKKTGVARATLAAQGREALGILALDSEAVLAAIQGA